MLREDACAAAEVNDVVDEVSEMAAEADELMAEMAEALEATIQSHKTSGMSNGAIRSAEEKVKAALGKYKETQND